MKTKLLLAALAMTALAVAGRADDGKKADSQTVVFLGGPRPVVMKVDLRANGKSVQGSWEEAVDKVFKFLDVNDDGKLTAEEASRIPPTEVLFGGGNAATRRLLVAGGKTVPGGPEGIDADGDGKVTREELAAYLMRTGGTPFRIEFGQSQALPRGIVLAPGMAGAGPTSADAINAALFNLLDADRDGKLSKEELAAAPGLLKRLDTDDDEMLGLDELLPGSGASSTTAAQLAKAELLAAGKAGAQPVNNSPFVVASTKQAAEGLAQRLLARYGGKDARTLSRQEVGLDRETFAALDADRNGALDAAELAGVADLPADVEVVVRLGKRAANEEAVEVVRKKDRAGVDVTADGGMLAVTMGVSRIAMRVGAPEDPGAYGGLRVVQIADQELMRFKLADTDGNGYLDEKEAMADPLFRTAFKQMDRDGDGKLYEKEVKEYLALIKDVQAAAKSGTAVLNVADQGRGLFDLLDTRRDGKLSLRELREAVKLLDKLDRDGDGLLGLSEVPKSYQMNFDQGGGVGTGTFAFAVSLAGQGAPPTLPEPTEGPLWFRKWDRNRDGDLSRREFGGTDEEFRKIDADGDGLISRQEAENYDASLRRKR